MAATFETQAAYFTRSIVDHEHKVIVRVASRTAKTLITDAGKRLRMIVTDGVFSMDGTVAPLPEIVALADKYDATIFVDECHATG